MVHQRGQPDLVVTGEIGQMLQQIGRRHLAAQMETVLRPQPVFVMRRLQSVGKPARLPAFETIVFVGAQTQAIEYRGYA
jgi:hypothetical protein